MDIEDTEPLPQLRSPEMLDADTPHRGWGGKGMHMRVPFNGPVAVQLRTWLHLCGKNVMGPMSLF